MIGTLSLYISQNSLACDELIRGLQQLFKSESGEHRRGLQEHFKSDSGENYMNMKFRTFSFNR